MATTQPSPPQPPSPLAASAQPPSPLASPPQASPPQGSSPQAASPSQRKPGGFRLATRLFNPLAMRLAGTRIFPLYGVLEHRGRRSGKAFRTPVVVRPAPDGFIVPMPWGEGTDWYRNVRAAGGAVIRWKGRLYAVDRPEVLDTESQRGSFSALQQKGMTRFGIRKVLHLHHRALAA